MSIAIEAVAGSDGEYRITCPWERIATLHRRVRCGDVGALWAVGATLGRAALFGHPARFRAGSVSTVGFKLTTQIPYEYRHSSRDVDFANTEHFATVPLFDIDPRTVRASQPGLQGAAMRHYLTVPYEATGELFDKTRNASNDWPVVLKDESSGELIVLQGHHRTTAALLAGRFVRARVVLGRLKKAGAR